MVHSPQVLERTFHALADSTRLAIVERLAAGETSVSQLAEPFPMSLTAVRKHLRVLEEAGLVRCSKHGRVRTCRLDPEPLSPALDWLRDRRLLWEQRLQRMDQYLAEEQSTDDQ